jgi:hypothetical protein
MFPWDHDMLINFNLHKFSVMIMGPLDVFQGVKVS